MSTRARRAPRAERMRALSASALLVALLVAPAALRGQTNERVYEELNLRTVTPGARAAGMGRTFVGLADDATAAYSNPAGLSNLQDPEFSFEFQLTESRHERYVPGEGDEATEVYGGTRLVPSFMSGVIPLKRATLSIFRNRLQDYREEFSYDGRFVPAVGEVDTAYGSIAIQSDFYGVGAAYLVTDWLSLGGALGLATLDVGVLGRSGTPLNPRNGSTTIDTGSDLAGSVSLLLKPLPGVSLGAVYHAPSRFGLTTELFGRFLEHGQDVIRTGEERPIEYVIPERYAFGAAWRLSERFSLLGDAVFVRYSQQITERFLVVDFMDPDAGLSRANFSYRDVWELHAGAEFRTYAPGLTYAVRAGVFTDPDHQLRFTPASNGHLAQRILDYQFNSLPQKTRVGVAAGAGIAWGNRLQLDLAVSHSDRSDDLVLSMVLKL